VLNFQDVFIGELSGLNWKFRSITLNLEKWWRCDEKIMYWVV
jgi:hypothetical protein